MPSTGNITAPIAASCPAIFPCSFAQTHEPNNSAAYLADPTALKLAEFFWKKGLPALNTEDAAEDWYEDWQDYQAHHRLYASVLAPKNLSAFGHSFDLPRLCRLIELVAYFSPSHGYSLQTTFLGFFSIMMGTNADLKREAVAALESGGLLAFGVSEKQHGSDLLNNEFVITESTPGQFIANGSKYYIGNANCAAMVSILAKKVKSPTDHNQKRAPFALIALRPPQSPAYGNVKKIRTLGVRTAFVGEFEVKDHPMPANDIIAEGRDAWDAIFGTVTLGKFLLGFGSIGICEHALEEAVAHLSSRILYQKPVADMPHIRFDLAQAFARLTAMKLYAFRALDYVQTASADDRRYVLFSAVQKARVSVEGVKVLAKLSECIGAKGFEADTYFESALRDIQLIPGLESSTHINLGQTAQFIAQYIEGADPNLRFPPSLTANPAPSQENQYLMQARTGALNKVSFPDFRRAYASLLHLANVRRFDKQVTAFAALAHVQKVDADSKDQRIAQALGTCLSIIVYAQLIAENAVLLNIEPPMISAIFHLLVHELSNAASAFAALPGLNPSARRFAGRLIAIPYTSDAEWKFGADKMNPKPTTRAGEGRQT